MPKLKCNVKNCVYNCEKRCCKSVIHVMGKTADSIIDTCCGSYHKRKNEVNNYNTEFASLDGINQYVSIECESVNCVFNNQKVCMSKEVNIDKANHHAKESICDTFTKTVVI